MKNRIKLTALLCVLVLVLSGCSGMFDKEYREVEPYEDDYIEVKDDSSVQEIRNYRGMKNALLNLINSAAEYGVIRTAEYDGVIDDDISRACFEVTREEPMGIYAVDYIAHSVKRIVSYYEIEVYITYKRSEEEIAGVTSVSSAAEAQIELRNTLENGDTSLALLQIASTLERFDVETGILTHYRANPLLIPVCPDVEVNIYAADENAIQSITEILLDYGYDKDELKGMTAELYRYVRQVIDIGHYGDVDYIAKTVMSRCTPVVSGESTAYAALVGNGEVDSEGYAMAMKLMCNSSGIDSYVVKGRKNGDVHFWNIVNIRGRHYHIDAYSSDTEEKMMEFMVDSEMSDLYEWDRENYPACGESAG